MPKIEKLRIRINQHRIIEEERQFPENIKFMGSIRLLKVDQAACSRWDKLNAIYFPDLEEIYYKFHS